MGKKIGILLENRFIDKEIQFYMEYFPKAGFDLHFLTRLWGQESLTFHGMEENTRMDVKESFEMLSKDDLKEYAAIIMPAGYVADYLLYDEEPKKKSPAVLFLESVMGEGSIVKGFICHALWVAGPSREVMKGRKVTCHNNIISHVENAGMVYEDKDICIDGDLVTARTGADYKVFADAIVKKIMQQKEC